MAHIDDPPAVLSKESEQEDLDTDAILAELENEEVSHNDSTYQSRLNELKSQQSQQLSAGLATAQSSPYRILTSDDETLQFTTTNPRAVLHFAHPDFSRCATMDQHISQIARRHAEAESGGEDVAFGKIDVEKAPFVVERLGVRVLPCVLGFGDGVVKGRVIGFEGLVWNQDKRSEGSGSVTVSLERKLVEWGVLKEALLEDVDESDEEIESLKSKIAGGRLSQRRGIKGAQPRRIDEDEDWD